MGAPSAGSYCMPASVRGPVHWAGADHDTHRTSTMAFPATFASVANASYTARTVYCLLLPVHTSVARASLEELL